MTITWVGLKQMEDLVFNLNGLVIQQITDRKSVLNGIAIVRLYTIFIPTSYGLQQITQPTIYSRFDKNVVFSGVSPPYYWLETASGLKNISDSWNLILDKNSYYMDPNFEI
jgi:hypothetical protein